MPKAYLIKLVAIAELFDMLQIITRERKVILMDRPILLVVGTRPEGIKMIPVYLELKKAGLRVVLCSTSQHQELLSSVFSLFSIEPDIDLQVMTRHQDLFSVTERILTKMQKILQEINPCLVLVQGDTTTTFATALAAFYSQIPIGHIEAGLRTDDLYSPFPEEMNRRFVSLVAAYHFAPTAGAAAQVLTNGAHRDTVFCTGNTVVDALYTIQEKISSGSITISPHITTLTNGIKTAGQKCGLLTIHRRESFADGIERVIRTVKSALDTWEDLVIIYPTHPNPRIQEILSRIESYNHERFVICEPLSYPDLVHVLSSCDWVMTDSGGIQEEATCLGKPTLVLRETTERMESIWIGLAKLVGTHPQKILREIDLLMKHDRPVTQPEELYGDGHASQKIVRIISQKLGLYQPAIRQNEVAL